MGTTAISRRHNNNTLYVAMDSSFYLQPQLAPELQTLRSSCIHTISIWLSNVHLQSIRSKTELLIFCLRFSHLVNDTNSVAQAKNTRVILDSFLFLIPSRQYISKTLSPVYNQNHPLLSFSKATIMVQGQHHGPSPQCLYCCNSLLQASLLLSLFPLQLLFHSIE